MFPFRGAIVEFVATENGEVTRLIVHAVEGAFKGPHIDRLRRRTAPRFAPQERPS